MRPHEGTAWRELWLRVQARLFPPLSDDEPTRVCVVVPAFLVMGGVQTVLDGIAQVMRDTWHIEYLTQYMPSQHPSYVVHRFGTRLMTPLYFPFAWLYVITGVIKLLVLAKRGKRYHVLLSQDGVFSSLLAGISGKLTGARVVCIDHAEISLFTPRNSRIYREERIAAVSTKSWPWPVRIAARSLLALYWPSRLLAAHMAARLVDHYLIPGIPGDSIEEGCKIIGVSPGRVTRFGSMIDIARHTLPDATTRIALRQARGLPSDAVIVTIAARLSPEKSLDIALECISRALAALTPNRRTRVRVVIAGDGPLRKQLEQEVQQRDLENICLFLGELPPDEVLTLFGISDIFLYTSMRGACMAMAVLEAMASGCAVIASTEPLSNAMLLAGERGIAVPAGDSGRTSNALLALLNDVERCHRMGLRAREYISSYHNPASFRRVLLQVTDSVGPIDRVLTGSLEPERLYAGVQHEE